MLVNPAFPLFVDDDRERARLGDFPLTGRVLEPAEEPLRRLLRLCANTPRTRAELHGLIAEVPPGEIDAAVETLLGARVLVDEADVARLTADERLSRQALFLSMFHPADRVETALRELGEARITVLGAGAIGGAVALQLVTAGVRNLRLVDDDRVEVSNLHRQHLYTPADVGTPKVKAAARRLLEHRPDAAVETAERRLAGADDVAGVVGDADFVVNTVDTPQPHIRRWVNQACVDAGVPFASGGFTQHVGMVGPLVVPRETACLACQETRFAARYDRAELPLPENLGRTMPAFAPLCAAVSGLLASEVVRYLTGTGPCAIEDATVYLDLVELSVTTRRAGRVDGCRVCS
ncbi:ThiF family adenylyltransferase [Bailinhaonella thermotolerans]|uniref:ThiF family adenylyltransferase n=1 Tax=Bailinhaonella thermotolerans TaxID=1070861 RepID=A0A3A4B4Z4_9ACTN|nr:ThiF family adenylyltransferase [Bailinhaonella thermotolerans]